MNNTLKKIYEFTKLVLRAVATAMGVAVVALSIMGEIELKNAVLLLGIGLAGAGISSLMSKRNEEN